METIIQSIIEYQFVVPRLLTALFLSSMIGVERSRKNRAAGLRTHALVGVASALSWSLQPIFSMNIML
jgi:uncharacterized membrane protein YhiD involved in acid resistance